MLKLKMKEGIKGVMRNARDGGYPSVMGYLRSPEIWRLIPRQVRHLRVEDFEIHILSGRARLTMALWMISSWIAVTGRNWKFVIHDDGTLCAADMARLERVLPCCKTMLSTKSNPAIHEMLSEHPLCLQCRNLHPLGRKLFDIPLFACQDKLLSIDTDILFFLKPYLLLKWISGQNAEGSLFMEDIKDSSLVSVGDVEHLFGIPLVQRVNTGIVGLHKKILSLDFIEDCLGSTGILRKDRWYVEQTLFAIVASRFGRVELLPQEYAISEGSHCPANTVARHYVGAVRQYFYSEGLSRIRLMLDEGRMAQKNCENNFH